jgi:hypothetical protein
MARTKISSGNDKDLTKQRLSYIDWMMKIQSVHYSCGVELDKGIAKVIQYNLSNSK